MKHEHHRFIGNTNEKGMDQLKWDDIDYDSMVEILEFGPFLKMKREPLNYEDIQAEFEANEEICNADFYSSRRRIREQDSLLKLQKREP